MDCYQTIQSCSWKAFHEHERIRLASTAAESARLALSTAVLAGRSGRNCLLRVGGEPTRNKREKRPPTATTTMSRLLSAAHTCYPTLLTINCSSTLILLYSSAAACCCLLPLDVVFDRPSRHRRRRPLARAGKGRKKEKKAQACQANPFPVPPGMHIQNFILRIDAH